MELDTTQQLHATFLEAYRSGKTTKEAADIANQKHGTKIPNRTISKLVDEFEKKDFEIIRRRSVFGIDLIFRAIPYDIYGWEYEIHPAVYAAVAHKDWNVWSVEVFVGNQWHGFDYDSAGGDVAAIKRLLDRVELVDFFNNLSMHVNHLPKSWVRLVQPILKAQYEALPEQRRMSLRNFDPENKLLDCID